MSITIRILFDECVGTPVLEAIKRVFDLFELNVEVKHIRDFQMNGVADEQWIPQIAAEGWIIITADRGKCGGSTQKLPRICLEYKLTHVILSSAVHHQKTADKAASIISVWRKLVEAVSTATPGTRFSLQFSGQDRRLAIVTVKPT